MAPPLKTAVAVASFALLGGLAAACGGTDGVADTTPGDATPTLEPSPVAGGPSPTPTFVSVLDSLGQPTAEVAAPDAPEPTPTFDPGEVILPTFVAPTVVAPNPLDADLQARLDEIEPRVAALRELYAIEDTNRNFIDQAELEERLASDFAEEREEFDTFSRLYAILGVTEPGVELYDLFLELYSAQVLGFYDHELNELYVVDADTSDLSPQDHLTYTHEFVHALQQQHFDIDSVLSSEEIRGNADRAAAYRALVEGDAILLETIYMFQNMSQEEQAIAQDFGVDLSVFFEAPHLIQRNFVFPYVEGAQFVLQTYAETGWRGVNAIYDRSPVSTEQILHPEKYRNGEAPIPVTVPALDGVLGDGWSELARDTFGEFSLMAYLEDLLTGQRAATAAAGWGGDEYVLYLGPDDSDLLVQRIEWDTVGDAAEFFGAFASFTEARLLREWELIDGEGSAIRMVAPGRAIYAVNRGTTTDFVFAPEESVLDLVRGALAPHEEPPPGGDVNTVDTVDTEEGEQRTSTDPDPQPLEGEQEG